MGAREEGPSEAGGRGAAPPPRGSRAEPRSGEHGAGTRAAGVGPRRLRRWGGGALRQAPGARPPVLLVFRREVRVLLDELVEGAREVEHGLTAVERPDAGAH